jgi:hypothetical protein
MRTRMTLTNACQRGVVATLFANTCVPQQRRNASLACQNASTTVQAVCMLNSYTVCVNYLVEEVLNNVYIMRVIFLYKAIVLQ